MRLNPIEHDVKEILTTNEMTRNDDMYLYRVYIQYKQADFLKCFVSGRYRITRGIAPYESVSRIRRKVQEIEPALRPTKESIRRKRELEKEYRKYARGIK